MLASRILPPIPPSPPPAPPVATFFNIPRRYVKSNMQVSDNTSSSSTTGEVKPPWTLRKRNKIHQLRCTSTSNPGRTNEEESPSPASSSPKSAKKIVASFGDDISGVESVDANSPTNSRALPSASSTASGEFSSHVCICQLEPKIPRPRNAFILYRQHHQHAIVRRNPGLANPEISKIIGEQWKAETDDQKKIWQDLAQEEKVRHHEQYPDYRYRPRRPSKPGSHPLNPSGQHTTAEKYHCPRCGGRTIKTPVSPFPTLPGIPTLPPPNISEALTSTTRYLPMRSKLSLESLEQRHRPDPLTFNNIRMPTSAREDTTMHSPPTPESKRRRYSNFPTSNSSGCHSEPPYYSHSLDSRRDSLPPIQMHQSSSSSATMPPPRMPHNVHRGSINLNVLVPNQYDQSQSVEAMVMSIPYFVKIQVLGRITPPLKEPGPTSPAISTRGAIIAVEGDDATATKELTNWLNDSLTKDNKYSPRIVEPPRLPREGHEEVTLEEYLDLIKEWHGKSREMINYITTPITRPSSLLFEEAKDVKMVAKDEDTTALLTPLSASLSSSKPVIILPTYQLRASDAWASKIPIQDVYSPMDHWQWMATLWRGTVGPDLTIYVKDAEKDEGNGSGKLVDINDEVRCLTVLKEREAEFADAALRRVWFEVNEWIIRLDVKVT